MRVVSAFPPVPIFEIPGKLQAAWLLAAGFRPGSCSNPLILGEGVKSRCRRQRAGAEARGAAHVRAVIQGENGPDLLQLNPLPWTESNLFLMGGTSTGGLRTLNLVLIKP